ncbi:SEC-C metal-binding domain-containing protein [Bradyrhizobium tropiciagri]
MGERKRRREAVLNGPCPCGSQKTARHCCFQVQAPRLLLAP